LKRIGVILTLLEQRKSWRPFIPSPAGAGIAMLIPINAVTVISVTKNSGSVGDRSRQVIGAEVFR